MDVLILPDEIIILRKKKRVGEEKSKSFTFFPFFFARSIMCDAKSRETFLDKMVLESPPLPLLDDEERVSRHK